MKVSPDLEWILTMATHRIFVVHTSVKLTIIVCQHFRTEMAAAFSSCKVLGDYHINTLHAYKILLKLETSSVGISCSSFAIAQSPVRDISSTNPQGDVQKAVSWSPVLSIPPESMTNIELHRNYCPKMIFINPFRSFFIRILYNLP